jgi:hypothetical protein
LNKRIRFIGMIVDRARVFVALKTVFHIMLQTASCSLARLVSLSTPWTITT